MRQASNPPRFSGPPPKNSSFFSSPGDSAFAAPLGDGRIAGLVHNGAFLFSPPEILACSPHLAALVRKGNEKASVASLINNLAQHGSAGPEVAGALNKMAEKGELANSELMMPSLPDVAACVRVAEELESIGWDAVKIVDERFAAVELQLIDSQMRLHALKLLLNVHGKPVEAVSDTPLPLVLGASWSITMAFEQFRILVERFQKLWMELDAIDHNARVLDPVLPALKSISYRRLALMDKNGAVSLATAHVQLAMDDPCSAPCGCELIGPELSIAPF